VVITGRAVRALAGEKQISRCSTSKSFQDQTWGRAFVVVCHPIGGQPGLGTRCWGDLYLEGRAAICATAARGRWHGRVGAAVQIWECPGARLKEGCAGLLEESQTPIP
jgi:hypothetical protein